MQSDIMLTVSKYIEDNSIIKNGDTVIIGLSGGKDSMVLCHILEKLRFSIRFKLMAAHMDHRLRDESGEDALFVAGYCAKNNIPLYNSVVDVGMEAVKTKTSIEVAARNIRHTFFKAVLAENQGARLALAHHMNDKTETMLMRLIRGTSIDGMSPMPCKDGNIIRPLMCITRNEIDDFAKSNDLNWREDKTNSSTEYTRNYLRHEIIPKIEQLNPSVHQTFAAEANTFQRDTEYINEQAAFYIEKAHKTTDGYMMDKDDFASTHPALRTRIIKMLFANLGKTHDLHEVHINAVDSLFNDGRTGALIEIDKNYSARCHPMGIELIKNTDAPAILEKTIIALDGITYLNNGGSIECSIVPVPDKDKLIHSKNICYVDMMAIDGDLFVRSRQDGDVFHPFGAKGKKKLKDYFIDKKINRWERDSIPIVASENNIVWIAGYTIDDRYKVSEDTACCMKIVYKKGDI